MSGGPVKYLTPSTASTVTGNVNTLVAGSVVEGPAFDRSLTSMGTACVLVSVLAQTTNLTFTGKWQVSQDKSTWYDVAGPNNAANVALATGTAGVDVAVTKVLDAPSSCYAFPAFRFCLVTGGAGGAAQDTYSIANYGNRRTVFNVR